MDAIVYTSNTGSTARYAQLLSEKTGLPAYPLDEAQRSLPANAEVIYLGWVMASGIQGLKTAAKRFKLRAVCAVGMGRTGTQTELLRSKNPVPDTVPLFTLQGTFDLNKLRGVYRAMMNVMVKTVGKKLSAKPDRSPDEDDMLDMMLNGSERVSAENLTAVTDWYAAAAEHK